MLDFIAEIDYQATVDKEARQATSHQANNDAIWRWHMKDYPITDEDRQWLPAGVRICHFVHPSECEVCPTELCCEDHTEGWKWGGKVCLKDVRVLESQLGHKLVSTYKYSRKE
jgi:hypothetical protein